MSLAAPFLLLSVASAPLLPSPSAPAVCVDASTPAVSVMASGRAGVDSMLVRLYESGTTWDGFLGAARARREMWMRHATQGVLPADAVARAQALPGRWRLLVIAVDSCSDSVNTIPFLARLVAAVPQLEMRVISPSAGRALMEARPTPDGRAATPTVIVLNEAGEEAGCWIERPAALQAIAIEARAGGGTADFASRKAAWYESDAGASTVNEVVAVLERAAAGARGCESASPPARL
jgi:hypothetical protein